MSITYLTTLPRPNGTEDLWQFVATISHDLKEPLRTIHCFAELLAQKSEPTGDNATDGCLTRIKDAANRMQTLIDDALTFTLADGSGTERTQVDAGAVLQFALSNLEGAIAQADAAICSDRLPVVSANFGALAQVFQNLISNAIKYRTDEKPRIHVGCTRVGTCWVFSVADNGIGIKPEYYEQVFVPLRRLHSQQWCPGTGLGLAICRRIIGSHGGRIWLRSKFGVGSTFYFTIPASAELRKPRLPTADDARSLDRNFGKLQEETPLTKVNTLIPD